MLAGTLARRALCIVRSASAPPRLPLRSRQLHVTAPVLKKRQAASDVESLFDDLEVVDESSPSPPKVAETTGASPATASTSGRTRAKLSPEQRAQEFNKVIGFVKPRVGRTPQEKLPEVRNSTWFTMLQLAASEADLRQITALMPGWVPSGRVFKAAISEAFVRRCEELKCGTLALEVYGDFAKYNLTLTLPGARRLLHSVYRSSIQNVMTASALFGVYKLPAAAQDYVSCAFVVEACLRHNSEDSVAIARALLPHLRQLEKVTKIDKEDTANRENVWVQKCMENIEKHLKNPPAPKAVPLEADSAPAEQTVSA